MKQVDKYTHPYDFRVVKKDDIVIDVATSGASKSVYVLYECHYDANGDVASMSVINDMTCYDRMDATDFLLRVSAATLKPILDANGEVIEECLVDPGRAVLSYLYKR